MAYSLTVEKIMEMFDLKLDFEKAFSISFIDDFLDCSYRTFLSRILKTPRSMSPNAQFGQACHAGLNVLNLLSKAGIDPCEKCPNTCRLNSKQRGEALKVPAKDCVTKQLLNAEFMKFFDTGIQNEIIQVFKDKGKLEEGKEFVELGLRVGPAAMAETVFIKQPIGKVLEAETYLTGKLGDYKVCGKLDNLLECMSPRTHEPTVILADYKTRGTRPSSGDFPMRQLAFYVKLLLDKGIHVSQLLTLYLLRMDSPKKPRKPFEQAIAHYIDLQQNISHYDTALETLVQDMGAITKSMKAGCFSRNRNSMFCPCDQAKYCFNDSEILALSNERIISNDEGTPNKSSK